MLRTMFPHICCYLLDSASPPAAFVRLLLLLLLRKKGEAEYEWKGHQLRPHHHHRRQTVRESGWTDCLGRGMKTRLRI
ncbi:hypothetical protein LZ30DRAFT_705196, partial [Colletotrichum cereale]